MWDNALADDELSVPVLLIARNETVISLGKLCFKNKGAFKLPTKTQIYTNAV